MPRLDAAVDDAHARAAPGRAAERPVARDPGGPRPRSGERLHGRPVDGVGGEESLGGLGHLPRDAYRTARVERRGGAAGSRRRHRDAASDYLCACACASTSGRRRRRPRLLVRLVRVASASMRCRRDAPRRRAHRRRSDAISLVSHRVPPVRGSVFPPDGGPARGSSHTRSSPVRLGTIAHPMRDTLRALRDVLASPRAAPAAGRLGGVDDRQPGLPGDPVGGRLPRRRWCDRGRPADARCAWRVSAVASPFTAILADRGRRGG